MFLMTGIIINNLTKEKLKVQPSYQAHSNSEELYRLQRLLEIFIEVDKKLKKQSNEQKDNK